MSNAIRVSSLDSLRPKKIRILMVQTRTEASDWQPERGLWVPSESADFAHWIDLAVGKARQEAVDLVLMPELSVPVEHMPALQTWSKQTGGVVVGGSHYHRTASGTVSRSPIIIAGEVFFTEKLTPAPIEVSPIRGEGLSCGTQINVFKGSAIGDFAVLICSDYLDPQIRMAVLGYNLDLLCVPAFQRDSMMYHERMNVDCNESECGLYIAYANMLCDEGGDGCSAVFGVMDSLFVGKLLQAGQTDGKPANKLFEIQGHAEYLVVEVDIEKKRPSVPRTVHSRPNVVLISTGGPPLAAKQEFLKEIAHDDERYRSIDQLFVAPVEYDSIVEKLERFRLVFIVGDPGIGKTYTAVRLLLQYFEKAYTPIWFTGLEKEERRIQRQVLSDFRPKERQIIYFEDPFGRTVFERRDAISRVFGPLVDRLRETDARVIVTSRREIFEQFSQESLTAEEFAEFREELSVVKPSYSKEALQEILDKLAVNRCHWYGSDACRKVVTDAIRDGILTTPLAIRDLVFATERVDTPWLLETRIVRRQRETTFDFAQEIQSSNAATKLALLLVYAFGYKHQLTLRNWFTRVVRSQNASDIDFGSATLMQEIRPQMGYRVEQFGMTHSGLRFAHPVYEEAFVEMAMRDSTVMQLAVCLVETVAEVHIQTCANGILRSAGKYPQLTQSLLRVLVEYVRVSGRAQHVAYVGSKMVAAYDLTKDSGFLDLIKLLVSADDLVSFINTERAPDTIKDCLRFLVNYQMRVGSHDLTELDPRLEWVNVYRKIYNGSLYCITELLEWATYIRPTAAQELFSSWSRTIVQRWIAVIQPKHRQSLMARLQPLLADGPVYGMIEELSRKTPHANWRRYFNMLARSATNSKGVIVDKGAADAMKRGMNLLPPGVRAVVGEFSEGMPVAILDEDGGRVAVGLAEYSSADLTQIAGHHSSHIAEIIGRYNGQAVVRRWASSVGIALSRRSVHRTKKKYRKRGS